MENGGPAPEGVTDKIYELTKTLDTYKSLDAGEVGDARDSRRGFS